MKILIYGLNYAPELTGVGKYTGEMAAWLAARGHEVRVVTAPPYYPAWRVDRRFSSRRYRVESGEGAIPKVYRCPLWVPANPRGLTRMLHLSSFALSSIPVMAWQALWKPDIVFTVEPTFFAASVALMSASVSGAASWLHIQDFEIDAAFRLELLPPGGYVQKTAKQLERFFVSCFSRVSTISDKMLERISEQDQIRKDAVLFPNWGDLEAIQPTDRSASNRFREEHGLTEKIVFLYSGEYGSEAGVGRSGAARRIIQGRCTRSFSVLR